ncbi:MAG: GTPase ObgE [Chloroflexi bacterium]|nr:GTPase ObgE [Chloroflexota bacterium]
MIGKAVIVVKGGKGGNGGITFRKEKFVAKGGPDGGDGGKGGSVRLVAMGNMEDLSLVRYKRVFSGEPGGHGAGSKRSGKAGKDCVVEAPVGTVVWEGNAEKRGVFVGQVAADGDELAVAAGGEGGRGNTKFVSSTNKVPMLAEEGADGEEKELYLEHWPLVDVAVIGLPNSGKSQLLHAISRAFPAVTEYPFSTRDPVLGTTTVGWETLTVVEVPSLCEGAHEGKGLGNGFLTCAMRARLLLFLLDGASPDPTGDLRTLRRELKLYDPALAERAVGIAVNKADLPEVSERTGDLRRELEGEGLFLHFISATTGEGVEAMKALLAAALVTIPRDVVRLEAPPPKVRVRMPEPRPTVAREGAVFVVSSPRAARLVALPDLRVFQARLQLRRELSRMGVLQALEEAGVQSGDAVRIGKIELEWE